MSSRLRSAINAAQQGKILKSEANYRSANYDQIRYCRNCVYLNLDAARCSKVSGQIGFGAVCDLWKDYGIRHETNV